MLEIWFVLFDPRHSGLGCKCYEREIVLETPVSVAPFSKTSFL